MDRRPAPHLQAAISAAGWQPSAPRREVAQPSPAAHASHPAVDRFASHVQAGIRFQGRGKPPEAQGGRGAPSGDFVMYVEKKLGGSPPPPPKKPVYALGCDDKGRGCSLQSLETGRVAPAGDVFAGFVRMAKGGPVYVSPRPGPGLQGDSHPSIASLTPEWSRGQRALVAAGEIGIVGGEIIGHNDKTGHYQTRHNRQQSGLPTDRYHPYTQDSRDWYKRS